jgi:hypothetical protein
MTVLWSIWKLRNSDVLSEKSMAGDAYCVLQVCKVDMEMGHNPNRRSHKSAGECGKNVGSKSSKPAGLAVPEGQIFDLTA